MYEDEKSTVPAAWNDPARNAMDQMLENMRNFKESAASGQFTVSASAGDDLLRVIRMLQDWLGTDQSGTLDQRPLLGGSYGAVAMAPFVQQVASDQQGFLTQLARLRDVLGDAESGVRQAMANYGHTEQAVAGTFSK
ncbi:hypothetical protein [Kibdelosporangium phytohabitans]|uniref:Uncharacterized protein n=1 Tax=Kibdelosporangium phytohabitans TaxID=860235 RepID=A0A0N9IFT6_9PSEU|nr:hypothetical protein [Kibdelosporangium phytohabitans]ALG14164.1 hypothetical protein AOZ06_51375 [Kibdelosporangium phytohabitans]MBE1466847.1 hypothetical protein [Kibdelosporangium phytohabitans]